MEKIKTIKIKSKNPYKVYIQKGIIDNCASIIKNFANGKNVLIVTDSVVEKLYLTNLKNALKVLDKNVLSITLKNGEESKNLENFKIIIDFLAKNQFTRKDLVIALGGGVIGDLTGFVSACYLRGVNYVQIPTTLLSATDSSVGGKTAIDIEKGKNLVGAFYSPKAVIIDTEIIKNLPENVFLDGFGEVVKYAVLDKKIFNEITSKNRNLDKIISLCVSYKNKIVSADEFEKNKRKLLNLGHTYAHAIEKLSNYKLTHGIAVAIGVKKIVEYAIKSSVMLKEHGKKILNLIDQYYGNIEFDIDSIIDVIKNDKKRQGDFIELLVPAKIGKVRIVKTRIASLRSVYADCND